MSPSTRSRPALAALVVLALAAGAACGGGGGNDVGGGGGRGGGAPTSAPPSAAAPAAGVPAEVAAHVDDWPTAGHDYDNTRAASASTIDRGNVDRLEVAWRAELDGVGPLTTVPLVLGDTVYLQGGTGRIVALDRDTGEQRWSSDPRGFNIGPFGAAVGEGHVYGLDGSTGIVALDTDGTQAWATDITATDTTGVDIQPVVVDGLVIASSVPISIDGIYAPGDRGVVTALDAGTGEVRWSFDTVHGDDLWGHPDVNSGGGAWYPPVVDLDRRLVYVGVANPAPFPGTPEFPNGSSRPGPNLYTDSVVALDLDTGELAWFHQVTPHDIFDRDQVHTLMARQADGHDVLVSAGKSGVVVGLDPDDGTVRWQTDVGHHDNDDLRSLDGPTTVSPGTYGGVLTPPSTADGIVYLATVDAPTELTPDATAYFGAPLGTADGEVSAVDATTGEIVWEVAVPGDPLGGTAVVGDLVFTALLDGTILALDRADGEVAWRFDAGGGVNGWMSAAGDTLFVPVGSADPPTLLALRLPGG